MVAIRGKDAHANQSRHSTLPETDCLRQHAIRIGIQRRDWIAPLVASVNGLQSAIRAKICRLPFKAEISDHMFRNYRASSFMNQSNDSKQPA